MNAGGKLLTLLVGLMLSAGAVSAAEEDHTWSLGGELAAGDTNLVYIGLANETALTVATVELHFDTTVVDVAPYPNGQEGNYLTGRVSDFPTDPTDNDRGSNIRIVLFDFNEDIAAGSGDILQVRFVVNPGVAGGTMTGITLTTQGARDTLATRQFEIEGSVWDTPGDPGGFGWKIGGVGVADSNMAGIYISVTNSRWASDMELDLLFDSDMLQVAEPAADNVSLLGRATDLNLAVGYEAGSDSLRITTSRDTDTPPFPSIDPGSGAVVRVNFSVVGNPGGGDTTPITLRLADGSELATYNYQFRSYTGPSPDVDGNDETNIFDVLEFLKLWKSGPPTPFTDANGDGKSDIFDLLEILGAL